MEEDVQVDESVGGDCDQQPVELQVKIKSYPPIAKEGSFINDVTQIWAFCDLPSAWELHTRLVHTLKP